MKNTRIEKRVRAKGNVAVPQGFQSKQGVLMRETCSSEIILFKR